MAWPKTDPEFAGKISACFLDYPDVSQKKMFGMPAHFIHGNMWGGPFSDFIILRFDPETKAKLMEEYDEIRAFEPMPGRFMREYVSIPEYLFDDTGLRRDWMDASYRFTSQLPPKKKKRR